MININSVGLLIVDLQNDFLHSQGAYGRAGLKNSDIGALPSRIAPIANKLKKKDGWIVSTQFTLVPGKEKNPFISDHLIKLRPFLSKGDFLPGAWGHDLVEELKPADLTIEKVAYSAFYMTRLEWVLKKAEIEHLFVCGIVTNGGVASTVRDAHVRDFKVTVLSDGCAAFSPSVHQQSISDLSTIANVKTCSEVLEILENS